MRVCMRADERGDVPLSSHSLSAGMAVSTLTSGTDSVGPPTGCPRELHPLQLSVRLSDRLSVRLSVLLSVWQQLQ